MSEWALAKLAMVSVELTTWTTRTECLKHFRSLLNSPSSGSMARYNTPCAAGAATSVTAGDTFN